MIKKMIIIITAIDFIFILINSFTLFGVIALILLVASFIGIQFFEKGFNGKMPQFCLGVSIVALLLGTILGNPSTLVFSDATDIDQEILEEYYEKNHIPDAKTIAQIENLIENEKYDEAKNIINKLPYCNEKIKLQGKLLLAQDDNYNAGNTLSQIKNKDKESYEMLLRARLFQYKGKVNNTICDIAQDAAYDYPFEPYFMYMAGYTCYETDKYIQAAYYLGKTLEMEPDNPYANYYYALTAYVLGDTDQSLEYLDYALKCAKNEGGYEELIDSISEYKTLIKEGKE